LTALKAANEAKDAAEAKLKELDARLATIDRETAEIRHNAEREAERESARIIESANRLAQHLRDEARRVADAEIARAKQELRIAILKDVRQEVEKKIGQEFGEAQHNAYSAARAGAMQTLTGRQ
jgi:F-type H+-transporting ATPase subunit b